MSVYFSLLHRYLALTRSQLIAVGCSKKKLVAKEASHDDLSLNEHQLTFSYTDFVCVSIVHELHSSLANQKKLSMVILFVIRNSRCFQTRERKKKCLKFDEFDVIEVSNELIKSLFIPEHFFFFT